METTLTGDKTPEQELNDKIKKMIAETPEHNWYKGSIAPNIHPFTETIERQVIPETNLRELAATLSSKIEHKTVQEYLSDCDKIYQWLVQDEVNKRKQRKESAEGYQKMYEILYQDKTE